MGSNTVKQHFTDRYERDLVGFVRRHPCGGATAGAERASWHPIPRQRVRDRRAERGNNDQPSTTPPPRLAPLGASVGTLTVVISVCGLIGSRGFVLVGLHIHSAHPLALV